MLQIDKEYESAIRFYLDDIFNRKQSDTGKIKYDPNVAKSLTSYIRSISKDNNYKFSTPVSCLWNVTSACNFRCIHCLYNDTEYSAKNDLTHEQALSLANELINEFGITFVVLTGGEIFTRPDIMDIIRLFKENNVAVRLQTNAALISSCQADELSKLFNPYTDSIHISLDGATEATYKKVRQTNAFRKIIHNTRTLASKGIRVLSICTVNNININEVVDMYNLCIDMGIYEFIIGKTIHYNDSHDSLMVTDRDLFLAYQKLFSARQDAVRLSSALYSPVELLNIPEVRGIIEKEYIERINELYKEQPSRNCHYHDKIAINSDGTVYLCLEALSHNVAPLGCYKNQSLSDIWNGRLDNILFQDRNITDMQCKDCKLNRYCNSGCMIKSLAWSNNIYAPQVPCNVFT